MRYGQDSNIGDLHRSWTQVENEIESLTKKHKLKKASAETFRSSVNKLYEAGAIDDGVLNNMLALSAFRNKLAHTQRENVSEETCSLFSESAWKIADYLKTR